MGHGSSPRMRGKLPERLERHRRVRIIPAHAGQTACSASAARRRSDHPRACGANYSNPYTYHAPFGSSPRMRGKLWYYTCYCGWCRIIPAHAGQTWRSNRCQVCAPDHPRACGANDFLMYMTSSVTGSSPRMRGKRVSGVDVGGARRIIPAHAGQTPQVWKDG